jgi:hypothetical protein
MCRAGDFNLSYTSLTSREALKALHELVTVDPMFWAEITQPRSQGSVPNHAPPTLTSLQEQTEDLEESAIDINGDDSEVPMTDVVSAHTQLECSDSMDCDDDDELYIPGEEGGLVSTADAECASLESVQGEVVDATQATQAVEGRGKCKKRANILYSSKFWVANDGSDANEE